MPFDQEGVLKEVHDRGIEIVRLWFSDINGHIKGFAIPARELEDAFEQGMGFDGSSIEGFARIHESDLMAHPDPATFAIFPSNGGYKAARMFCDLKTPDRKPYPGDPRYVLQRNLERAAAMGFSLFVGPELEYFYFKDSNSTEILDHGGYFDASINEIGTLLRKKTIFALEEMGIPVEYSHHEVAPSQHEIDLRFGSALEMAERCLTYRFIVKEIARQAGYYATFMPKPMFGVNGSGMHTHQSLFSGGRNSFFDPNGDYSLSTTARHYLAGLLKYIREITAVLNQTVNSYKRLVPGYEAPVYISWGQMNRSALVRVPRIRIGKEKSTRVELRSPDPAANPYLAFAVMLAAGLKGIEEKLEAPSPVEEDIYHLTPSERERLGIGTLPGSLYEAVILAQESSLVKEALGDHVFEKFIENKLIEWDEYRMQVTDYERRSYLPVL
ncbi:MAG: glutamine synthetase [Calditrichaeota bacterium]|nr:glutamine synthetase [Calditrichota bacterium]